MQLNSIVFAAPKCSYSSQSLFKDIIYIPRSKDEWSNEENASIPMDSNAPETFLCGQPDGRVLLPMSAGELGNPASQQTQKFTFISDKSSPSTRKKCADGSIPCLFLDRPMKKVERDMQFSSKQVDLDDVHSVHSGTISPGYDSPDHQSTHSLNQAHDQISVTRGMNLSNSSKYSRKIIQEEGPGKIMLYFHANAEDLGMCYYMLDCLKERLGVRVLAMEYPGYGLHGYKGKDTKQLQKDALTVYDFVN